MKARLHDFMNASLLQVLGEMIIEMQLSSKDCGGHHVNEHIEGTVTTATQPFSDVTESFTTLLANFTERPEVEGEQLAVSGSEGHSIFSTCRHVHLLHQMEHVFHLTSIFILFTFNVELCLRLYIFGYKYFLHWENALDAIVVIVSFWLDVAFLDSSMKKYLYLLIILRLWRVLRIIHAIIHAIKTPFERQIEKLKKKRKILQRDLAKAYFYSNMLEEEITALRNRIADMEAAKREAEADEVTVDDEEEENDNEENQRTVSTIGGNTKSDQNNNKNESK